MYMKDNGNYRNICEHKIDFKIELPLPDMSVDISAPSGTAAQMLT